MSENILPNDRGFTLGDGAFETLLGANGVVFRLDEHLERLRQALGKLRIPEPPGLRERVLQEAEGPQRSAIRLTVTRGPAPGGLLPPAQVQPTVSVLRWDPPPPPPSLRGHIVRNPRNEKALGAGLKLLGYAEAILGVMEAEDAGADEALFLDLEGHLVEASASNVFVVQGGKLRTPPTSCGILPGVTRSWILESFEEASEAELYPDDLFSADEAFLSSTVRGVVPLVAVDGKPIGGGAPGPLTRKVQERLEAALAAAFG